MKHLYRITWSDGSLSTMRTTKKPYELFDIYDSLDKTMWAVVIERLN